MSDNPPIVQLSHVTFSYVPQQPPILDDVSLTVEAGDFLGIIGPNGGGKTTILKLMLGILKPQSGSVTILGQSPMQGRSQIGYVPQLAKIDAWAPASVLDLVRMGRLGQSSWGPCFGRSHTLVAMEALRQTETQDLAKRPIGTLSGGQRQRVLIARALAGEANLLLLDEPTAGVDVHMEHGLIDLLHRLNQQMPIVLVSHDISFVSTHLNRVACLNRKLTCHEVSEISDQVIAQMYHGHVRVVEHADDCPLSDPGCEKECGTKKG